MEYKPKANPPAAGIWKHVDLFISQGDIQKYIDFDYNFKSDKSTCVPLSHTIKTLLCS